MTSSNGKKLFSPILGLIVLFLLVLPIPFAIATFMPDVLAQYKADYRLIVAPHINQISELKPVSRPMAIDGTLLTVSPSSVDRLDIYEYYNGGCDGIDRYSKCYFQMLGISRPVVTLQNNGSNFLVDTTSSIFFHERAYDDAGYKARGFRHGDTLTVLASPATTTASATVWKATLLCGGDYSSCRNAAWLSLAKPLGILALCLLGFMGYASSLFRGNTQSNS